MLDKKSEPMVHYIFKKQRMLHLKKRTNDPLHTKNTILLFENSGPVVRYREKYVITFWIIDDSALMSHESSYENCTAANVGRVAVFP